MGNRRFGTKLELSSGKLQKLIEDAVRANPKQNELLARHLLGAKIKTAYWNPLRESLSICLEGINCFQVGELQEPHELDLR